MTDLTTFKLMGNDDFEDISIFVDILSNMPNLKSLWLTGNQISDINELSRLTRLENLYLANNPLNIEQVEELQAALPDTEIHFEQCDNCAHP